MTQTPSMNTVPSQYTQSAAPDQPRYEITEEDKKRQKRIADAWKAYEGDFAAPLQPLPGDPDDNVISNRMQAVVDRGVDFLFGKELEISVEEGAPAEAQHILDQTWGRKETRVTLLAKLAMSGGMAGEAFLRIVPEKNGTFRLIIIDPCTVFVQTDPQDCETVLLYCIQYCTNEKRMNKWMPIYYREEMARIDPDHDGDDGNPFVDVDATWCIQHWTKEGEHGPWMAAGDSIPWPYSFPPLFPCQNLPKPHDFWGYPDIVKSLVGVNDALNLLQSNTNRVNKFYGQPILYANGTGEQIIDIRPGKIMSLPLVESKISSVPIVSDIANALKFAGDMRSDIDEQSSVPGVATGRVDVIPHGNMSGIAIELAFMPLLKKTEKKRCLYGDLIINVSKALFVLNGLSEDLDVTLAWQNPLPHDDLQSAQSALAKQQIGISNTTLQRELGYDPDEEMELSRSEDAEKMARWMRGQASFPVQPLEATIPGTHPVQPQGGQPHEQG